MQGFTRRGDGCHAPAEVNNTVNTSGQSVNTYSGYSCTEGSVVLYEKYRVTWFSWGSCRLFQPRSYWESLAITINHGKLCQANHETTRSVQITVWWLPERVQVSLFESQSASSQYWEHWRELTFCWSRCIDKWSAEVCSFVQSDISEIGEVMLDWTRNQGPDITYVVLTSALTEKTIPFESLTTF